MDNRPAPETSSSTLGLQWFVVQTKPGKETVACRNLVNQGLQVFCPWTTRSKRIGTRAIEQKCAFFPGYVFVAFAAKEFAWRSINGTLGVSRLLSMGGAPAPLPCGLVEALMEKSDPDKGLGFAEELSPGDRVRIIGGAFDRLCGTLLTSDPRQRVHVLLDTLFGEARVQLRRARLVAA